MESYKKSKDILIVEKLDKQPPGLKKLAYQMREDAKAKIEDLMLFCAVIKSLNDGLEDERLENPQGTFRVMKELQDYQFLQDVPYVALFDRHPGPGGLPKIYFEV